MDNHTQQDLFVTTFLQNSRSQFNTTSSSNPPFKKRITTSPPPEEVASCAPPRFPLPDLFEKKDNQSNLAIQNRLLLTPPQSPTLSDHNGRSIESILHGVQEGLSHCAEVVFSRPELDEDTVMTNSDNEVITSQTVSLPVRPPATLTTLPPELTLHLLTYMPLDVHSKLYETNKHFHYTILQNDAYLYSKAIARAGSNPRGESSLSRAIFAFQYTDKPRKKIDPIVDLNSDETKQDLAVTHNIQYLRFLSVQSNVVQSITDEIQSKFYHDFLTSEFGLKELRLTAHGSHGVEDLLLTDEMDRDLMHLWEFVNYSHERLIHHHAQRKYPFSRQKTMYTPEYPPAKLGALELRKLPRTHKRSTSVPHNSFLMWERKRLRDSRNDYWREDAENLSKVESRDMRWILEVMKAAVVGRALSFMVEEEKATSYRSTALSNIEDPIQETLDNETLLNRLLEDINATTDWTANARDETSDGSSLPNEHNNDARGSIEDPILIGLPSTPPSPPSTPSTPSIPILRNVIMLTKSSPKFTPTDMRAYTSYLFATAGPKLLLRILRKSRELDRSLAAHELELILSQWDDERMINNNTIAEDICEVELDRGAAEEKDGPPAHIRQRRRVERVWERDCKRGGWRNWEGWVGEYYIIG